MLLQPSRVLLEFSPQPTIPHGFYNPNGVPYKLSLLMLSGTPSYRTVPLVRTHHRCLPFSKTGCDTLFRAKISTSVPSRSCQLPRQRPRRSRSSLNKRPNQRGLPASAAEEPRPLEQQTTVLPAKSAKPSVTDEDPTVHHASTRAKTAQATKYN